MLSISRRNVRLTPTEIEIFRDLSDGKFHSKEGLLKHISDSKDPDNVLYQYIFRIRRKLPDIRSGTTIVSARINGIVHYRLVRLVDINS